MKPHWNKEKPSSSLLRIFFHILAALSLLKVGTARILRVERRKFRQCVLFLFQELWTSQGKKLWAQEVKRQSWNWWPRQKCCFVQRLAAKSNHLETKTWDHIRKNSQEWSDKKCPEIVVEIAQKNILLLCFQGIVWFHFDPIKSEASNPSPFPWIARPNQAHVMSFQWPETKMTERVVALVDMDCFYCQVSQVICFSLFLPVQFKQSSFKFQLKDLNILMRFLNLDSAIWYLLLAV